MCIFLYGGIGLRFIDNVLGFGGFGGCLIFLLVLDCVIVGIDIVFGGIGGLLIFL